MSTKANTANFYTQSELKAINKAAYSVRPVNNKVFNTQTVSMIKFKMFCVLAAVDVILFGYVAIGIAKVFV